MRSSRQLTMLALLLGLVAVAAIAAVVRLAWSAPRNLVFNGSFADSVDGWQAWQGTRVRVERGDAGSGAARVLSTRGTPISRDAMIYTLPRPIVNLRPGATFTAGASVRGFRPGLRVCLVIREWALREQVGTAESCFIASGGWQRFPSVSYTTRGNGSELELLVKESPSHRGDWFAVDDVTLLSQR